MRRYRNLIGYTDLSQSAWDFHEVLRATASGTGFEGVGKRMLQYLSGEAIETGDLVVFGGEPGAVEFVALAGDPDPATAWYVEQYGGGCMVVTPKYGHVFVTVADEDLRFVSRAGGGGSSGT